MSNLNPLDTELIRARWTNIPFTRFLSNIINTPFCDSIFTSYTLGIKTLADSALQKFAITYIGQIFDNYGCPWKRKFILKIDNRTQVNLSSKITA